VYLGHVPWKHQLGLQAAFITKSSGSVYQRGQYRLFIEWVMMGLGIEVEIGVSACGTLCIQRGIRSSVNIQVQEWLQADLVLLMDVFKQNACNDRQIHRAFNRHHI
jgi:hypothetical protein